jgi:antitoxin (DNA-binding transcriptional repressor) of toxin-antitoxin stability system
VVITERNRPIARLLPIAPSENPGEADLAALVAAGVLLPPAGARLDVAAFLTAPRASLPPEASLTAAVRIEREEGR